MNEIIGQASSLHIPGTRRPCPACGNASRDQCDEVYSVPEFDVLRCRICKLTFVDHPIDDNVGFDVNYGIAVDPIATSKATKDFRNLKQELKKAGLANLRGPRLLDVGCGIGTFLLCPQQEGWDVAGLEISAAAATYGRDKRNLNVQTGSIEQITAFPSQSFDVVTMFGVIEHLANPLGAAKECARLLRPGGVLALQTPTEDGALRRLGRFLFWASGGRVRFHVKQFFQMGGGHSICFDRRSISNLLDRCGLVVLGIRQSTYGLRILVKRFENNPFLKRLVMSLGTTIVFVLGVMLGSSNHMTVYSLKRGPERSRERR